jgi:hypothetical protein
MLILTGSDGVEVGRVVDGRVPGGDGSHFFCEMADDRQLWKVGRY